jgi:hypothetical protein
VKAICVDIRPDARLIQVELPEGLEDLDSPTGAVEQRPA